MVRSIGLHLRVINNFTQMIEKAVRLEMPIFQCFLLLQETGKLLPLTDDDVKHYLAIRRTLFDNTYVHGSYRINLAGANDPTHFALMRELSMAKRLEFTHMILHAGAATGYASKHEGIAAMARCLNKLVRHENDIHIVLENAAHGNMVIGSDLEDFKQLKMLLDQPEKISYCIDTAHAHAYGYAIETEQQREAFITHIDTTLGLNNIALLHLNDTYETRGSKRDRHAALGQGTIGLDVLKQWAQHPRLRTIPIIMELPEISEEEEIVLLNMVRDWHHV